MSFKPVIEIIPKPDEAVECDKEYRIGDEYTVCINAKRKAYYVWDNVPEEIVISKEEIEKTLYRKLLRERVSEEEITEEIPREIRHVVTRQFYGYGNIDPFMKDKEIIDIHIVSGQKIQVVHREYGKLVTNVSLTNDEMETIISRMTSKAGKPYSEAKPLLSFIEPDHSARVTIVYLSDITLRKGMTIDIRKQPEKPWTILKLIDLGTLSFEAAAYLWLMMKYKVAIMVVGELMSGKTVLSNAVLNLVPPDSRVFTIEDTPELRLYVPYWTRTMTRESEKAPITVFDLLKIAMRITPDYIVVGEVRGKEARDWAQAILLGHGGITTMHASSPDAAIVRLTTPPIEVNPQALRLLNIFVKMIPLRTETGELRRRAEVYVHEDGKLYRVFGYDPVTDTIKTLVKDPLKFNFINRIVLAHGVLRDDLLAEYRKMVQILREVYTRAKKLSPTLETPDYKELPTILYNALRGGER